MSVAMAAPGSLTVPPLAGWEGVAGALLAVLAVALLFLLLGGLATGRRRRSPEWEAWLDARSRSPLEPGDRTPPPPLRHTPDGGRQLP